MDLGCTVIFHQTRKNGSHLGMCLFYAGIVTLRIKQTIQKIYKMNR